jgi:hypothetical protein
MWNPLRRHVLGSLVEETTEPAPAPAISTSKTWESTVGRVDSWPEEARLLKKHTWISYLYALGDLFLVVLPIYFVCKLLYDTLGMRLMYEVLGMAAAVLHNEPTKGSSFGSKVEFAMELVCLISLIVVFYLT